MIIHGLPFFMSFEGLQKSCRANLLLSELIALINSSCKILCKKVDILDDFSREMVILQDSGRKMVILQVSGRKMVILQVSGRMNGYLARFWQKSCKIMHNLARFWQNLPESCKITIRNRLGHIQVML